MAGFVAEVWQQNLGGANVVATAANWDAMFYLTPGYSIGSVSGGVGVGNQTGTGGGNGATTTNPEINTGTTGTNSLADDDVLGISFLSAVSGVKVGFGLFYADEGTERAIVTLTSGGVAVASYTVLANGAVSLTSGTDAFTLSLAGGNDNWGGGNPGESTLHIDAKTSSNATFDGIEFKSGGTSASGQVSDFYLTDLCATLAQTDGNDTIDGGGDNGRYTIATGAVIVGDDITGRGGEDTFIWKTGGGLDVVRDFNVHGDQLNFNDGGAYTLTAITFGGQDSTLVCTSNAATDGVVLQNVKVSDLGAGDILSKLTVNFDDFALGEGGEQKIADGYKGFNWTQTGVYNPNGALNYLATSPQNIGFIAEADNGEIPGYVDLGETAGAPVVITRATDFDFVGGEFTPEGRDGMVVNVQGWDDGVLVFSQNVTLGTINPDSSTSASFAFTSIDELRFNANDGNAGTNDYFGFDDLRFMV